METVKFVYLGEDLEFAKHMQKNLDSFYKELKIKIDIKSLKTDKDSRDFIFNKETQSYKLFIVDFSAHYPIYYYTATTLGFQNNYKTIPMMGLTGVETPDDHFLGGIFAGCKAIFVKGIEYSATVNFAVQLFKPKAVRPINWPSGTFAEDEVDCFAGFKINYFTKDYIQVETNLALSLEEEIQLNTVVANKMGLSKFKVIKELDTNFYYNLNKIYQLEILPSSKRIDPNLGLIDPAKKEPSGKVEGKALEVFLEFKKKLEKWINENLKTSTPKETKLLLIDQNLNIYQQAEKNTDQFPFSLFIHRNFDKDLNTLKRVRPNFLVINMDSEEEKERINTPNILPGLINKINEFKQFTPFIFLFNCSLSQSELQNKLNYPKIITYQGSFDFSLLKKLVEKFDKVRSVKESPQILEKMPGREKRVYLKKDAPQSFAFHPFKIRITAINETSISFKTSYTLEDYSVLKLEFPSKFWLTVLPPEKGAKESQGYLKSYTAAINGIGEMEKNQLRVYINKVFVPKEPEVKKTKEKKAS